MADDASPPPPGVKPEGGGAAADGGGSAPDDMLTIKVQTQDGAVIQFKTKRTTAVKKLMKVFAERQGVDINTVSFMFDGVRLTGQETPADLGMEDMDTLDVFLAQVGGGWW